MGTTSSLDDIHPQLNQTFPNYVEVAATMIPKRMTGIKHMLRPACRFLPMPMSLGWQENPIDDDYPQRLLIQGLQLTDVDSGATRTVTAPWMHALYATTYEEQISGVTEVNLEDAQFIKSFTWQHFAVLCVLSIQGILGLWAFGHHQFREGTFIFLGIFLQFMEGYFSWKFPSHRDPRSVEKPRKYVLHKGTATTHFLIISHQAANGPIPQSPDSYINLEDAAAPMPIPRKGYNRTFEASFRICLQLANLSLKIGCTLSQANGLLVPLTLLFGTIASEIIMITHTPLPRFSSMEQLETEDRRPSILDKVVAVCQRTGCASIGFVEAVLPDRDGTHIDFQWVDTILKSESALAAGVHPTHRTANDVLRAALKRRTYRVSNVTPFLTGLI